MIERTCFDPFNDRKSRDIRNNLSSSLRACIEKSDISPALGVADVYLGDDLAECYSSYIEERLKKYRKVIKILADGSKDPLWQGLVLWDEELFFEMHEVLEHAWYTATGDQKLIMQALIRAAGMYIKLECGFIPQAKKMAAKAVSVLEQHTGFLSSYFPPERLLNALKSTNPNPPRLLSPSGQDNTKATD